MLYLLGWMTSFFALWTGHAVVTRRRRAKRMPKKLQLMPVKVVGAKPPSASLLRMDEVEKAKLTRMLQTNLLAQQVFRTLTAPKPLPKIKSKGTRFPLTHIIV